VLPEPSLKPQLCSSEAAIIAAISSNFAAAIGIFSSNLLYKIYKFVVIAAYSSFVSSKKTTEKPDSVLHLSQSILSSNILYKTNP
jgi:hypothetical protein